MRPGYSPKCPIPKEMETWKRDSDEPVTKSEGVEGEGVDEGVMDDEWCHVTFCTHIDPGGSVPAFVTNLLGPNNSLKCLMSMKAGASSWWWWGEGGRHRSAHGAAVRVPRKG